MYSGNSLSNGFGSLIAAAVIKGMEGTAGLRGWRWLCMSISAVSPRLINHSYYRRAGDGCRWYCGIFHPPISPLKDSLAFGRTEAPGCVAHDWRRCGRGR